MSVEIPFRLALGGPDSRLEWIAADHARYTESFFEHTLRRLRQLPVNRGTPLRTTLLEELRNFSGPEPTAIVFHVSRCGSTLVAQMLAALPQHTVLAEPPLVDEVLRLHLHRPATTDGEKIALVRGAIAALARPHAAGCRRLFVKLDSWHIFTVPLMRRAFPTTPFVFLHRHPVEVLVSLMRRPSLTLVRDTVTPAQLGLTPSVRDALSPVEHASAILGAFFRAARTHRSELTTIDYTQLPDLVARGFPGCAFDDGEREALLAAAARDAKNPEQRFVPDAAAKRLEATDELLAAAEKFALPAYREFIADLS